MPMPAVSGSAWTRVRAQVTARWEAADPLLPAPSAPPGCGADLVVRGPGNQPVAIGTCSHWKGRPGSLDLTWGASRRYRLSAVAAGPEVTAALDELLSLWRDHLAGVPAATGDDTAAIVTWPSRDVEGPATLLRHGLAPLTVIAARPAGRGATAAVALPDATIRRAGPDDLAAVASLGLEVVRFDEHFGDVIERPETAGALRRE